VAEHAHRQRLQPLLVKLAVVGRCRGNGCPALQLRSCPVGCAGFGSPCPWPVAAVGHPLVFGCGRRRSLKPWARLPITVAAAWCRVAVGLGAQPVAEHGGWQTGQRLPEAFTASASRCTVEVGQISDPDTPTFSRSSRVNCLPLTTAPLDITEPTTSCGQ
jgi:hypothetical protein